MRSLIRLGGPRARTASAATILVLALGCASEETSAEREYWQRLEIRSEEVAVEFLTAASTADSAVLAPLTTDSIARIVSTMHREGESGVFESAVRSFRAGPREVRVFGNGALITGDALRRAHRRDALGAGFVVTSRALAERAHGYGHAAASSGAHPAYTSHPHTGGRSCGF